MVVRAPTEKEARGIAQENGMDELYEIEKTKRHLPIWSPDGPIPVWTNEELTSCVELSAEGPAELIVCI